MIGTAPSETCFNLVKQFEGCKLKAYQDVGGVWTIGYGATGMLIGPETTWTQDQANNDLIFRLNACGAQVRAAIGSNANQNQFDALTSLIYNIGVAAFRGSELVRLVNARSYQAAADQFLLWDHVKGVVVPGLLARRQHERALFLS
jgi:lysozyme